MRLGDGVKAITEAVGIPQCDACKQRQEWLNGLGERLASLLGGRKEEDHAVQERGTAETSLGKTP